jgi:hypothetical protein
VRVSVFGSCITRDVFRLFPGEADVRSYHSRSSIISVVAPPLAVDGSHADWPSNFARKVVLADFRKTFFEDLEAAAPDALIVDLMSERFDVLRGRGTYVTRSWELIASGFDRHCGYCFERVPRETNAMHDVWLEKSRSFATVLREHAPELPVILHKAYWTTNYRYGSKIRSFPRNWRWWISRRNELLELCHAQLERLLPDAIIVEPRGTYVADPAHRWGLGSSHYEHAYYEDVREQFAAALPLRTKAVPA